jgi:predicted Fe-Mo cluster-binding NifX family protein
MKVGIVMDDGRGIEGDVSVHFGQCRYFMLADIDSEKKVVAATRVVPNTVSYGGGGCVAVDELLKHNITHVIAGGMGMGAQTKFAQTGVRVFGYTGKVRDALNELLNNALGGLDACREHGDGECH